MKLDLLLKIVIVLLFSFVLAEYSIASMRCGTHLITTGGKNRIPAAEVERLCGSPYSKSGSTWLYIKGNQVYRLKFSGDGLREIYSEMRR